MKYETEINMDTENTMTIMISLIKEGSTILEFGSASGRLTKYLKETKQCKMYIVEIDEEAGEIAGRYAEDAIIGDILDYEWATKFGNISFDYILFADVLEHLLEPEEVLKKSKMMLAEEGKMIISIPNIAHNSVVVDLINNKFEYRKTGILDNTHIKFWSYDSMNKMLNSLGLFVEERRATYSQVGLNEFMNSYQDVPREIAAFLQTRKDGEVYQHVLLVTKKQVSETKSYLINHNSYLIAQVFLLCGEQTVEIEPLRKNIIEKDITNYIQYSITDNCDYLRVDPLNQSCVARVTCKGRKKFQTDFVKLNLASSNAVYVAEDIFWFDEEDPQIFYPVKDIEEVQIELEILEFFIQKNLLKQVIKYKDIIEQKENYIREYCGLANKLARKFRGIKNLFVK